jgi:hypothetical protein
MLEAATPPIRRALVAPLKVKVAPSFLPALTLKVIALVEPAVI